MIEKIGVVGLGYVGLPVAVALAERFADVIGIDISAARIDALKSGHDWTGEIYDERLESSGLALSGDGAQLADRSFIFVTVPTPIDHEKRPDLEPIRSACRMIAPHLAKGTIVVFESTVYPGVTEDVCGPLLAQLSGLEQGKDFFLGYSPERINPGDTLHRLEKITKVIAAENAEALQRVRAVYGGIIEAGLHEAPTIKVAEAAKVIENTQRDLNIALMNEIALIFDRMDIRTSDVLEAAGTKWNFLKFYPGLVGGHCIGVDPYYLTAAAERLGYRPEVILAGRRINDNMSAHVGRKMIKLLAQGSKPIREARVGIFGLTFKEDVPDIRNSRVPDIYRELADFGLQPLVHDPVASADDALREYGISLSSIDQFQDLDGIVLAVNHQQYGDQIGTLLARLGPESVLIDVKSMVNAASLPDGVRYWSL